MESWFQGQRQMQTDGQDALAIAYNAANAL